MEKFIKYIFVAIFLVSSCSEDPNFEKTNIELNEIFQINYGETFIIEGEALAISFTDVNEDSRCAEDVTCVWEGRLEIELTVNSQKTLISNLNNISLDQQSQVVIDGYTITFLAEPISPAAISSNTPSLEEYSVSLKVTRE